MTLNFLMKRENEAALTVLALTLVSSVTLVLFYRPKETFPGRDSQSVFSTDKQEK